MRLHAFILAVCVCAHHARAASIAPADKFDLDNVDLEDEPVVDNLRSNEVIPVKVVEEPVIDENSNDYIPPLDTNINVKRIEIDLTDTGPPQRQEHETQNPENFSENDKIAVSIKNTIEQAENVFNEGLKSVSDSFKTFTQSNENLPAIQQNIKNLRDTFTGQIEKLNQTVWNYLKPETASSDESVTNPKLEMVQARLKFLDNNFKLGLDTLTEGVEIYSIIKEEDEAEAAKAIALKADVKAEPEVANSESGSQAPAKPIDKPAPANPTPVNPPPANLPPSTGPVFPWTQYITNWQNAMGAAFTNVNNAISNTFSNTFNGNSNGNVQNAEQSSNPVINFFQGISLPNLFPSQNTGTPAQSGTDASGSQEQPPKPANAQADPAPAPAPPAPWSPQGIIQSVTSTVQSTWNNLINPGQNNQQQPQQQQNVQPQPANTNPIQQAIQNFVSFITPQPPQAQQPVNTANPVPPAAVVPEKVPQNPPNKPEVAADVQASNVVPAPVNEQPEIQPNQVNIYPAQPGPIQQLVQNNPIIKGIQSAVQRIQGTPNPETPREDAIQESGNEEEIPDSKGHGGFRPSNVNNQVTSWETLVNGLVHSVSALLNGTTTTVSTAVNSAINTVGAKCQLSGDSNDSGIEKKVEEKIQDTPSEEKKVLEEELKPEELKTPVDDKTE